MKKTSYYRAMTSKKEGITFKKYDGYLITFCNGYGSVDLVIGKNDFNRWAITEYSSGFLAHQLTFSTRKEAINAITFRHLKVIMDQMDRPFIIEAQNRLIRHKAALED